MITKRSQIVGIDPSLTGCGVATAQTLIKLNPPKGRDRGPARLVWIRDNVEKLLLSTSARLVVIEGYSFGSRNGGERLGELGGVLRAMFYENGVEYVEIVPTTLKKFATGVGKGDKVGIIIEARSRLGYLGKNPDEADALWLREAGLAAYGLSRAKLCTGAAEHIKKVVEWPWLAHD